MPARLCVAALLSLALCAGDAAQPPAARAGGGGELSQLAARLSLSLDSGSGIDETDDASIEPFTLYGTITKSYVIERLEAGRIVRRDRGVTASACVAAVPASRETPGFVGQSGREKLRSGGGAAPPSCASASVAGAVARTAELAPACVPACRAACGAALAAQAAQTRSSTGFVLSGGAAQRLARACTRSCAYECTKPGRAFDFALPWRP